MHNGKVNTLNEGESRGEKVSKNSTNICILFVIFDLKKSVHCIKQLSQHFICPFSKELCKYMHYEN